MKFTTEFNFYGFWSHKVDEWSHLTSTLQIESNWKENKKLFRLFFITRCRV